MIAVSIALALSACGGGSSGGSSEASTATGQFKDANTGGLSYVSGAQSGVTRSDGSFTYEIGKTVFFSIGGVTIGSTNGKVVVTPIDLIPDGSSSDPEVQNIVRLLTMLDSDGDASNGITISKEVQDIAKSWEQIDFSAADLVAELGSIIVGVGAADSRVAVLLSAADAQSHLESTLICSYSGAYRGKYTGGDNGNFLALIDASTGDMGGISYSTQYDEMTIVTGKTPIGYNQNVEFVGENVGTGATFTGSFTSIDKVTGTWNNTVASIDGNFSGSRIGGAKNAMYRFTGRFDGDDSGGFTFDIDSSNNVTGVSYSIVNDELLTGTGNLSGSLLTVTVSNTVITATIDVATGVLSSGVWNNSTGGSSSGTFIGSGCRLN